MTTYKYLLLLFSFGLTIINANGQYQKNVKALTPFASGLTSVVSIVHAGDSRLFVVNQRGKIVIIDSTGFVNPIPFLDISNKVNYGGERGLLGLAFHPKYKTNGYFFVNYVGKGDTTHISKFSVLKDNENKADSLNETKLISIKQPYSNHNGGDLQFGPNGYLYIGLGDGGSGGDPENRSQNPKELLGKMLRIDVEHGSPYSIPTSNPYYNSTTVLNEIWAMGLRNPWKFSFDRSTGELWIADVGQDIEEEINWQSSNSNGGENYGWRCYEGNLAYNTDSCSAKSNYTFPVHTYAHGSECSVTGGYVYRGNQASSYYGHYFFADYCSDKIWTLYNNNGNWTTELFGQYAGNNFSTFGEDLSGQLYIAGLTSGTIYRLIDNITFQPLERKFNTFKIIQNSSSGIIQINSNDEVIPNTILNIYDLKGIKLIQETITENHFEFNMNQLPSGLYLLSITTNGYRLINKLIFRN